MADIFVSYTSSDRDWAFWIGQLLEELRHKVHVHEWEISGGGDIMAWMEEHHHEAGHVLCVVSEAYLKAPYSALERRAAQWAAITKRPNFVLPVFIESCEAPTLFALFKRCDLHGLSEEGAKARLAEFLKPAARPSGPVPFPGRKKSPGGEDAAAPVAFPGKADSRKEKTGGISNIPTAVPQHFLGRDDDLAAIDTALKSNNGRATLHGLRGVGKTILAAAYAERHSEDYKATWWVRAETESTMRADLVGLGVQLGWVAPDGAEEPALAGVLAQLRDYGEGVLLIYDNAIGPNEVGKFLPRGAKPRIIVTSNAPNWRGVATPVPINVWPNDVGADFLMARTGRAAERNAALALSEALGGLPLAHEQAAAYCERVGIALADYKRRFDAAPVTLLDGQDDASREYHDGLTAAKTFALAIEEAAKRLPAAASLIAYASILAPEPIPLYLFSEGRKKFSEPFASSIEGRGLDEVVAALRAFALIDREATPDERYPTISTDSVRLHRLVRQVASAKHNADAQSEIARELIAAIALIYPAGVHRDPATWPRARRLDAIALALIYRSDDLPRGSEVDAANLLCKLDAYRDGALAAYAEAQKLSEHALRIYESALGPEHPDTANSLNNLGYLRRVQGDFAGARPYYERALAICEKVLGPEHSDTAGCLNNLGYLLQMQGDLAGARPYYERALAIREKVAGTEHPDTARSLNNLGYLLQSQGDLEDARPYYERALAIREKTLGLEHPDTALSLNNLGYLLQSQGDLAGAQSYYERALTICEDALGAEHPDTAASATNLGGMLQAQGDFAKGRPYLERALAIYEKVLGPNHPDTARSLNNLGGLLKQQGNVMEARPYFERALAILEKVLGAAHPSTRKVAHNTIKALEALKLRKEARALRKKFG